MHADSVGHTVHEGRQATHHAYMVTRCGRWRGTKLVEIAASAEVTSSTDQECTIDRPIQVHEFKRLAQLITHCNVQCVTPGGPLQSNREQRSSEVKRNSLLFRVELGVVVAPGKPHLEPFAGLQHGIGQ